VLDAVIATNVGQPSRLVDLARNGLGALDGKRIAVLGLAFKPDTDDVRESPAFPVIRELLAERAVVTVHDPVANDAARQVLGTDDVTFARDLEHAVDGADAVVIVTRWDQFQALPKLLQGRDPQALVIDGRRMLDRGSVTRYAGIGLGRALGQAQGEGERSEPGGRGSRRKGTADDHRRPSA
jgi:UDPglucose 6-dehydrogenase/GDP-mannose 6-dehydrogenase